MLFKLFKHLIIFNNFDLIIFITIIIILIIIM